VAATVLAGACEVINPGPVGDEFIDLPASQQGLINGSWERMNRLIGWNAYRDGLPAREIFPGGQTGNYGHSVSRQAGNMGDWDEAGPQGNTSYNNGQQARWIAEEAVRRFEARGDVDAEVMASALIAAGYANRVNGDVYCWGVIDSGPLLEGSEYWQRAVGHFTSAIAIATESASIDAAHAGRAQARLALEDWAGALADAQQVPTDFVLHVRMGGTSRANGNQVFFGQAGQPYRGWTVRFTFYDTYYTETGDPRTPWREYPQVTDRGCVGALQGYGGVPCTQAWKYQSDEDDIRIASGAEMRLIEAEAMLRMNPGNWAAAMQIINDNRTSHVSEFTKEPLEPWAASSLDDAWTYLMRERGIEFWLEGRRFTDMRRWEPYIRQYGTFAADGQTVIPLEPTTPGTLDWPDFEGVMNNPETNLFTQNLRGRPAIEDQSLPRELCYNISGTERANNPNFVDEEEEP
jgi:hypothetical protein